MSIEPIRKGFLEVQLELANNGGRFIIFGNGVLRVSECRISSPIPQSNNGDPFSSAQNEIAILIMRTVRPAFRRASFEIAKFNESEKIIQGVLQNALR